MFITADKFVYVCVCMWCTHMSVCVFVCVCTYVGVYVCVFVFLHQLLYQSIMGGLDGLSSSFGRIVLRAGVYNNSAISCVSHAHQLKQVHLIHHFECVRYIRMK